MDSHGPLPEKVWLSQADFMTFSPGLRLGSGLAGRATCDSNSPHLLDKILWKELAPLRQTQLLSSVVLAHGLRFPPLKHEGFK